MSGQCTGTCKRSPDRASYGKQCRSLTKARSPTGEYLCHLHGGIRPRLTSIKLEVRK